MKRHLFFLASLAMLISLNLNAQNERTLLFECFTNTGCGPCASQNPALDALINANGDRVAAIKYHMSWPGNNDPMYLHNTADNDARKGVYGVNAVPHTVVDGIRFGDVPSGLNQNTVNNWLAIESPFEMRLSTEVDLTANTITVNVMGKASAAVDGNLRLYVGVIEKEIHFTSAPGSNGERDFYSVMKKLLPSASGTTIGSFEAGDYFAKSYTWELANIYDNSQLDAIAWIQDPTSKEVYQACHSAQSIEPFFANEAGVSNISNVKSMICSGVAQPVLELCNYGSITLTSADIEVYVNGELCKTMQWTGSLNAFEKANVEVGEISFPVVESNLIEAKIVSVNGTTDEAPNNDVTTLEFAGTPDIAGKTLKLSIRTDNKPQETTWEVKSLTTGQVVAQGGPYTDPNKMHNETITLVGDDCYDFTIYDAGGDGLTDGTGVYGLKAGSNTLFSGNDFGFSESNEFYYEMSVGIDENEATAIYPNPTSGNVNIFCEDEQIVTIYNMAGQRVYETRANGMLQIDLSVFGVGIFAIQIGEHAQRVIVE